MMSKLDLSLKKAEICCFSFQISGCMKEVALLLVDVLKFARLVMLSSVLVGVVMLFWHK